MGYEINFKCFQWVIGAISDRFLTNQGVPNISVMLLMFSDIRTSLFFFLHLRYTAAPTAERSFLPKQGTKQAIWD